jgi:hypothetical protein
MGFIEFLKLLPALLKFKDQIVSLIGLLQKTPSQKHQELMSKIEDAFNDIKNKKDPSALSDIINRS